MMRQVDATDLGVRGAPDLATIDAPRYPNGNGPTGRFLHGVWFIAALCGWLTLAVVLGWLIGIAVTEDLYLTRQTFDAAVFRTETIAAMAGVAYSVVTMALIAPLVGYRFRDGLFMLVPIYSIVFLIRMLWRFTALPHRYWDHRERMDIPTAAPPASDQTLTGNATKAPPRVRRPRPVGAIAGLAGFLIVGGGLGYLVLQPSDPWTSTRVDGMSISLPSAFLVTTDPDEFVRGLREPGANLGESSLDPVIDDVAQMIEQFPDFFVLAAAEPDDSFGTNLVVMRFPSGGMPFTDSAALFSDGLEQSPAELIGETTTTLGADRYQAFRYDTMLEGAALKTRSVTFLVDGRSQLWTFEFTSTADRFGEYLQVFEESIASLELP